MRTSASLTGRWARLFVFPSRRCLRWTVSSVPAGLRCSRLRTFRLKPPKIWNILGRSLDSRPAGGFQSDTRIIPHYPQTEAECLEGFILRTDKKFWSVLLSSWTNTPWGDGGHVSNIAVLVSLLKVRFINPDGIIVLLKHVYHSQTHSQSSSSWDTSFSPITGL